MSEDTTSRKTKLLLAALMLIWGGVSLNGVMTLEEEGRDVCERLAHRFEKYPGEERPCQIRRVDAEGQHLVTLRARYDDGELASAEFDKDGDGAFETVMDCTWSGRVMMPLFHTNRWLGVAVSKEMQKGTSALEFIELSTESDGEQTVVVSEATPDGGGLVHRRRDRRNAKDQLVERRFYQDSFAPPIRTLVMTYDENGRVETVARRTEAPPTESVTRLAYQCDSEGR